MPLDRRHDHEASECNVVVEGLLCEGTFARREAGWLGVGGSPCGTSVVGIRRMNQTKKQKAMSEDKSLLASDPFPRAPQVLKGKESSAQTKQMERCLTPILTLAFVGQGHEKDLAQEHEGKPKAGRRAGVSDRRAPE